MSSPVVLCILDGWGLSEDDAGNAPKLAHTPHVDELMASCPNATLITHGPDAGLPKGQMGNSEVGHTNIGAGRVVAMDLGQIDLAIEDGSFFTNEVLLGFAETLKESGGTAHLIGVISDGGVHGHLNHVLAAARAMIDQDVPCVVHAITDGRDVPPKSADAFLQQFERELPNEAQVATVIGRYYALDRDNRWDRVERAWRAMALGDGSNNPSSDATIARAYADGTTDEFIEPTVIGDYKGMHPEDGILCLNFRADRAREILAAIGDPNFDSFDISQRPTLAARLGMVDYSKQHKEYMDAIFPKKQVVNTLGAWVAKAGKRQFRVAETEKYPHVTFFLNGGKEDPEPGEDRVMPKSPNVATYDLKPEMSASDVADRLVEAITEGYDLIVVNFANPDMVGHTGDLSAAIAACEAVDAGLGRALDALDAKGGAIVVTADHGNCETMIDPDTGGPHTAHTLNPVPVIVKGAPEGASLRDGRLADLAPTILDLMNMDPPQEMTGQTLIVRT
ncbi:MAG: 2,3-bisphosphoglycerate-independent phosphoglycerate mutase [Pseudomonadota bacterium]